MRTRFAAVCLIAALLAVPLPARAGTVVQIAVLDFAGPEEGWVGRGIALLIERELLARDGVTVLDRRELGTVLDEAGLAASGLLTPEARRDLRVGAIDLAVVGTWERTESGGIRISALVLDTATGGAVAHAMETTPVADLSAAAARITAKIAADLASRAPGIAAPPRFVLPPVPAEEITSLTLAAEAEERGDDPTAYLQLAKGLVGRPDSVELRLALGRLLLRMGEPLHAAFAFRKAAARGHPAVASEAISLLARIFEHDLGRFDLAAAAYRELIRRFPHVGDVERSRIREIELLDRAGRGADAYLRLMEHRDRLLARLANLDEKTRWFGYPYSSLASAVNRFEQWLAQRWVDIGDAERSGLPRPTTVHLVEEDGLTLTVGPDDLGYGSIRGDRRFYLVAPPARSIVSVEIEAETGPTNGIPPAGTPEDQIGVRVAAGWQTLHLGAGNPPRGIETTTLVFDEPERVQSLFVDVGFRWRRLYGMTVKIELGGPVRETVAPPKPLWGNPERIVSGVAGAVSWIDAAADGDDLVITFCDVATWLGPGTGAYPWPVGKDADLYLARRRADGKTSVERLPLSSEREDLYPTLARAPDGVWRLLWLSNRRTGFMFEPFTATSKDLRHWSWPRPVDLGRPAARPLISRDLMWSNLGQTIPLSAPRLFADPDGRWWLFGQAFFRPGSFGACLFTSDDGEVYRDPVILTKDRPGDAVLAASPGGGVEVAWVEREGEYVPDREDVVHTLRRFRVVGGRVAGEWRVPLGAAVPRNPTTVVPRPWFGPDGALYAGWARFVDAPPGDSERTHLPLSLSLFRCDRSGGAKACGEGLLIPGGSRQPVTVATTGGIHLLWPWDRYYLMRPVEGGLYHYLAELPGRAVTTTPQEPVELPEANWNSEAPLTALILPFSVTGTKDDAALAEAATALLAEAIAGGPQLRLVTREHLDRVLRELTSDERRGTGGESRLGKLVGADLVYSGEIAVDGGEATVVIREISVATTKIRVQRRWTGKTKILPAMLASIAAETGNPWYDLETGVERFADDAAARFHFVSSVSDVLSGISARAAGGFFEALRLGLDYPPTRYWLARALSDLNDRAGAETEYGKYLAESPGGVFAADARARLEGLAGSVPTASAWIPRIEEDGGEGDLLTRIYRGRSMDERVAALSAFVAGPGRDDPGALLEIFDLEADEWFRFQVLTTLRDLDPRIMLRAVAREIRAGASTGNELGEFFRDVDAKPWVGGLLLECLTAEPSPERDELWTGLCAMPGWPIDWKPLPEQFARAAVAALRSGDAARVDRGLTLLMKASDGVDFEEIARIYEDEGLPDELRKKAATALVRADLKRAWGRFEPRLLAGKDAELLKDQIYFIPVDVEPERLRKLMVDPATKGWYGLLLEKAKKVMPGRLGELALEMMASPSPIVRLHGVHLVDEKILETTPGARSALIRISRTDAAPAPRQAAFSSRCRFANVDEAGELIEEIVGISPDYMQGSALDMLAWGLGFRPAPRYTDDVEEWRAWLEFFRTEREKTASWIEELRDKKEPTTDRAIEIFKALGESRDPEAARTIGEFLDRHRFQPENEPTQAVKRAARAAVNRILTALGFPEHLLPGEGVRLPVWFLENDPGTFRPWRR